MRRHFIIGALGFLVFLSLSWAPPARGDDQVPEKRPCHVSASVEWNYEEGGKITEGSLDFMAIGTLKLSEHLRKPLSKMQGNINYVVEGIDLQYSYNEKVTEKDPAFCRENPVVEEWSASGSYRFGGGDPSGAGLYIRNVGTMSPPASMVKEAGAGAEQFLAMLQAQAPQVVTNYYEFFGFGTPPAGVKKGIEINGRIRKSDCTYRDSSKKLNPAVSIRIKIPEDGKLEGEETWSAKYWGGLSLFRIGVSNLPETMEVEPFKPAKVGAGGDITYRLKWSFEEVKPEIRIYRVAESEEKSGDITGEEVETIIGEKITLAAKALGLLDQKLEKPRWRIDGKYIESYKVEGQGENAVTKLDGEVDLEKEEVSFTWTRGDFSGEPMQVQVTGWIGEEEATGETIFKVFAPRIAGRRVRCSPHVTLGERSDPGSAVPRGSLDGVSCAELDADPEKYFDNLNRRCSVYAGKVESMCDEGKVERGFTAAHTVEVPWIPEKGYALQYVQLIIEHSLTTNHGGEPKLEENNHWCLDTQYPYSGRAFSLPDTSGEAGDISADGRASCSGPRCLITMEDTPELVLEQGTMRVLYYGAYSHDFESFLMFRPANRESDEETFWVPLEKVKWGWSAVAERQKDSAGEYLSWMLNLPCREAYTVQHSSSPAESGCSYQKNPDFPEWDCNVKKNDQ